MQKKRKKRRKRKNNEAALVEPKKAEEEKKGKGNENHQMYNDNFNVMDIDNNGMIKNDEHQKNIDDLNLSLHSYENETEEEFKLRKIIPT